MTDSAVTRSCFVTLAGRPNVGKSTLLNKIVGRKVAITSPRPQTTRNRIVGIYTRPGLQIVFMDTPGVMREKSKLNRFMTGVAAGAGGEADILLFMTEAARIDIEADLFAYRRIGRKGGATFLLVNKSDAAPKDKILSVIGQLTEKIGPFDEVVPLSAKSGENLDTLLKLLEEKAPEGPAFYPDDMVTDQPERFFVAEIVREKAFLFLREELPYATAVKVEDMVDRPDGLVAILASIFVERDSQKGIVIGKGGATLKKIGQSARQELEARFETKVYLELAVKVKPKWTGDLRSLDDLGYSER